MLETEIVGLHPQILVKILDEFAVQVEGFPHMLHIMHKIVEDMVTTIKERIFRRAAKLHHADHVRYEKRYTSL